MTLIRLFFEFLKIGLFSVGGGMATLPFLYDMADKTGWFTYAQIADMLAVSESTPGPIGINMATYVGFTVKGIPGVIVATIGEITPSVIVILIVAAMLKKFRDSKLVNHAFYGLRPASTALIGAACVSVVLEVLTHVTITAPAGSIVNHFSLEAASGLLNWPGLLLAAVLLVLTNWVKPTKNLHPIVFIILSAVVGIAAGAA